MLVQRAEGARIAITRSGRLVSVAGLALLAPLILSACVADGDRLTGTANLSPKPSDETKVADATGAKPEVVEIASADAGPRRVIAPSAKPSAQPVAVADAKGGRVVAAPAVLASREAEPASLTTKAVNTAVAAKDSVKGGVVAAKDTVVAGATKVGSGAVAVASASVDTMKTVAKAVGDTISGDPKIDRLIAEAADENDIPRELAYAVVRVESHYKPNAIGGGAYGLSQIKPATARGLGFEGPASALFDPETNLRYGMRYLKGALEKGGGDVCQAAMKYKGGHRTTVMSKSASVYCSNVKRHMAAIRARKTPAMGEASTLVAAVEPTARTGLIARQVAAQPAPAKGVATAAPAVAAMASESAPAESSARAAVMSVPASAPVPAARPVRVAENQPQKTQSPAARPTAGSIGVGSMVGGRVVRRSEPDASRFGGTFDASAPASAAPGDTLGFN